MREEIDILRHFSESKSDCGSEKCCFDFHLFVAQITCCHHQPSSSTKVKRERKERRGGERECADFLGRENDLFRPKIGTKGEKPL